MGRLIRIVSRWVAWALLAATIFVTLSPVEWRPVTGAQPALERFAAFAVLGGMYCIAYPRRRLAVLLFLLVLAGGLELLQALVPSRDGRIYDAAAKALGAGTGVLVVGQLTAWLPGLFRPNTNEPMR